MEFKKKFAKKAWTVLLMSMLCVVSFAQTRQVTGTVVDGTGEAVIGANVSEVGTTNGVITDLDGRFILTVQPNAEIQISFIGYQTQTIKVGNQTDIHVTLKDDTEVLDEVVVIGYQTVKRRDLTGSVASVRGKDVVATPVSNVAQALQGKLPGVNVVSQDGRPNAEVSIRIRGGGSISQSNEPLVLIDGVSGSLSDIPADQIESIDVLKDASSTAIYGARGANGVILVTTKGAKEGKVMVSYNGYAKFNTPTKYLEALNPYDYVAYTWGHVAAQGDAYREPFEKVYGIGQYGDINAYKSVPMTDLQREVYNSSFSHNHDLTVTGGTENTKILFSMNYTDEQGMKVNSYSKRSSVSLKLNQKIRKNLDFALDLRYTDTGNMGDEGTTSGSGSLLSSSYRFRPIATNDLLGDVDALREGNMEHYGKFSQWDVYSPLSRMKDFEPLEKSQALRATASLNWQIIKGLTYHTDLTMSRGWKQTEKWGGAIYNNYIDDVTGEKLYAGDVEDFIKSDSWNMRWTNTLNYDLEINKKQRLNILLGHEVTNSGGTEMRIQADHFPANFTKENAFAMVNQYDKDASLSTNFSSKISTPSRILSFFARANYNLLDRYLLTVTFRADGSSKFAPSHRWGYFPAAALGWRISEEEFMKDINWLDNLKLRLSYGTVGNDGIDSDLWSQSWTSETDQRWQYGMNNAYLGSYDMTSEEMANDELKWETTITRNLGIDFGVLKNRLWGSIDLYWNTTKDLLMNTPLPGITGFTSTYKNVGQTSNKGLELSLGGVIFQNKDWSITASANINFNKNNVDELAEGITGIYGTAWVMQNNPNNDYILMEGEPVGLVRGLVYDGFYTTSDFTYNNGMYTLKEGVDDLSSTIISQFHGVQDGVDRPSGQVAYPGMPKFRDMDGNHVIDQEDYRVIGDMNPVHTGGFNINAVYKDFDLGMYFNWSYGNEIYNVNKLASLYGGKEAGAYENKLAIVNDSYRIYDIRDGQLVRITDPSELVALNANASLPLGYNETGIVSTLGIEDGSYLRLGTLTLGYTFPKNLISKAGISNLRIYGSIYNVFTITGYSGLDPEVNSNSNLNHAVYPTPGLDWGTYPRARSFVVGVNLSF